MKNHLKRIAAPHTWSIFRKDRVFITRPHPSGHSFDLCLPLGIVLRDYLKLVATMREAKKLLYSQEVLVDGTRRKDVHYAVGLFDVVTFPLIKSSYRLILAKNGKLLPVAIDQKEANVKICKVVGKSVQPKGKLQLNLHDGRNIVSDQKVAVGDSILFNFVEKKIQEVLSLQPDMHIFLARGKYRGASGQLKQILEQEVIYTSEEQEVKTAKRHAFVVGKKNAAISLGV